ncbi:response regulator [Desulfosporosinus hippei]|uniref:Stage 0 sporulation protein A homolog n=1 Tax=Desulfosporosinus hippei DSM 8344 TaxID=1121419 RepID=A0A1G7WB87_9FIRM|nr:response regulator [Desulfosporosinus hippei]SDG69144.1 two-component system, NtrC family, response regulator [Desulfosporosinus hippei DSM 8344]
MYPELRVLIVDDEEEILIALAQLLRLDGYNVHTASSPITALEMIKGTKYHIILSDIVMPEMNGLELLTQIKEYDPLAQVIMMTGYSTMEITMLSLEKGASDYILKPFKEFKDVSKIVKLNEEKLKRWWESMRGNFK